MIALYFVVRCSQRRSEIRHAHRLLRELGLRALADTAAEARLGPRPKLAARVADPATPGAACRGVLQRIAAGEPGDVHELAAMLQETLAQESPTGSSDSSSC